MKLDYTHLGAVEGKQGISASDLLLYYESFRITEKRTTAKKKVVYKSKHYINQSEHSVQKHTALLYNESLILNIRTYQSVHERNEQKMPTENWYFDIIFCT